MKTGLIIGKNFSLVNPTKNVDFQDEAIWIIKDHKVPKGEFMLKTFGKLLFEAAANFTVRV